MNKNLKNSKGITLIALVITIIVMLILVTVTIRVATDGALFNHAANATSRTRIEAEKENEILSGSILGDSIEDIVAEQTGSPVGMWYETEDGKITNGKSVVEIGDYINYHCYNGTNYSESGYEVTESSNTDIKWQVLGSENGSLLIVSKNPLDDIRLEGVDGYNNGVSKLNTICEIYGHGQNALNARSIKIEDLNIIIGYDPEYDAINNTGEISGKPCGYGRIYQYKNGPITYEKTSSNITYTYGDNQTGTYGNSSTKLLNFGATESSTTLTIQESLYYYYRTNILSNDAKKGNLLFGDGTYSGAKIYWLASTSSQPTTNRSVLGINVCESASWVCRC